MQGQRFGGQGPPRFQPIDDPGGREGGPTTGDEIVDLPPRLVLAQNARSSAASRLLQLRGAPAINVVVDKYGNALIAHSIRPDLIDILRNESAKFKSRIITVQRSRLL